MTTYVPEIVPDLSDPKILQAFLEKEFRSISRSLFASDMVSLDPSFAVPPKPSEGMIQYADGVSWNPGGGEGYYGYINGAWVKLDNKWEVISSGTVTSVSSVDITNLSAYRILRINGKASPATDGTVLYLRYSTNNGSSFDAGANYPMSFNHVDTVASVGGNNNQSGVLFSAINGQGNAANEGVAFEGLIYDFNKALMAYALSRGSFRDTGGNTNMLHSGSYYTGTTARNALRLVYLAGNIASMHYVLEGIRG